MENSACPGTNNNGDEPIDSTVESSGKQKRESKETQAVRQKSKRAVCPTCDFPQKTCICPSLPTEPLSGIFQRCRIVVLQHPHELRRKNRSLPLVELSLLGRDHPKKGENGQATNASAESLHNASQSKSIEKIEPVASETQNVEDEDFVMKTIVGRRFGDHCDASVMKILRDPNEVVVLVFPHPDALYLEDGLTLAEKRCGFENDDNKSDDIDTASNNSKPSKKMTLIFLDATWKHAREMDSKTTAAGVWPENMIRVQMAPTDLAKKDTKDENNNNDPKIAFVQRRFQIRAPPSPDHLSTAECLAWIASRVERNPHIFEGIMKVLDYMVELWKGFATADESRNGNGRARDKDNGNNNVSCSTGRGRGFTDGDGCMAGEGWDSMSQKRRKIKHRR